MSSSMRLLIRIVLAKGKWSADHPPSGMRLHTTMVVERHKLCQCMWEAESIDVVRNYLEPELGEASINTYGLVDLIEPLADGEIR